MNLYLVLEDAMDAADKILRVSEMRLWVSGWQGWDIFFCEDIVGWARSDVPGPLKKNPTTSNI